MCLHSHWAILEVAMSKRLTLAATAAFACVLSAAPLSLHTSPDGNVSLSVDSASAYYRAYRQEYLPAGYGPYTWAPGYVGYSYSGYVYTYAYPHRPYWHWRGWRNGRYFW